MEARGVQVRGIHAADPLEGHQPHLGGIRCRVLLVGALASLVCGCLPPERPGTLVPSPRIGPPAVILSPAPTHASVPMGTPRMPDSWRLVGLSDPPIHFSVPGDWQAEVQLAAHDAPAPDPDAGLKAAAMQRLVFGLWRSGGYAAATSGAIQIDDGRPKAGYVDVFIDDRFWNSVEELAASRNDELEPISRQRLGDGTVMGGPAVIVELDDILESEAQADQQRSDRLRAIWYFSLLSDGRGIIVAVGTHDAMGLDRPAADLDELAKFAPVVVSSFELE